MFNMNTRIKKSIYLNIQIVVYRAKGFAHAILFSYQITFKYF